MSLGFKSSIFLFLIFISFSCSDDPSEPTVEIINPLENPEDGPPAGYADGDYPIPAEAGLADVSNPDHVIGDGTLSSCTGQLVVDAIARGGKIVFDCGPDPITIILPETARIFNDASDEVVIDGGGLVTLSGDGRRRILYMNTCDQDLTWTTPHCQNQDHPRVTVQNITFANGNAINETEYTGGGAIWARGGRLKIVNSRFFNNACATTGPDVGGGAVRAFDQYEDQPLYVVNSTFGGAEGYGNSGSNGGGVSSIGVSWTIINSLFSYNEAVGNGGNPAQPNTPGGGSGGAIYNDGNEMRLEVLGSLVENNDVVQHGAAIFFVSNNRTGSVLIDRSIIRNNIGGTWYTQYPSISAHDDTPITVMNSTITD